MNRLHLQAGARIGRRQRGFVLLATLIFLIVLTLLQLGLANSTTAEEKVARNFRDQALALQAAEAALRDAELRITGAYMSPSPYLRDYQFTTTCASGLCDSTDTSAQPRRLDNTDFYATGTTATTLGTTTLSPQMQGLAAANQPRYMIELVSTPLNAYQRAYRITVQARGRFAGTRLTLQSVYLPSD